MPPWHQTAPPPCASPSSHVRQQVQYTTPQRIGVDDEGYVHRSALATSIQWLLLKQCPHRGEWQRKCRWRRVYTAIVRHDRSRISGFTSSHTSPTRIWKELHWIAQISSAQAFNRAAILPEATTATDLGGSQDPWTAATASARRTWGLPPPWPPPPQTTLAPPQCIHRRNRPRNTLWRRGPTATMAGANGSGGWGEIEERG
jgi:hypothetical protein